MSSFKAFCTLLISSLAAFTVQQLPAPTLPGTCPEFNSTSLNNPDFNGDWYAVYGVKKGIEVQHQYTMKCLEISASRKPDGNLEIVFNLIKNGKQHTNTLLGTAIDGKNTKFSVKKVFDDHAPMNMTLTILDTDNTDYFVSVTCSDNGSNHTYFVQVFSRSKTLSPVNKVKVIEMLHGMDIQDELKPIDQNC